ncbi:MAG: hypothetical protein ACM3QS_14865 [Bacteroidota bacterium]
MRSKPALLILLFALVLSACRTRAPETPAAPPTDTPTPAPTLTPTPSNPLAILVLPADMDQEASNLYQKTVYDLAEAAGYRFQVRNSLTAADVTDATLKVVIAFPPDPGIAALAAAAPQARFLAINIPNLTAGGNLSVLSSVSDADKTAFLAGYTAALLTDDYHVGMIIPKDNPQAQRALQAFQNGMSYYCGLCRPFYFVDWNYPQSIEIPTDEQKSRYGAYADYLIIQRKVGTLYVYRDVATPDLLSYIGTTGTLSIADESPSPKPASFVMAMQPDVVKAIQGAWPGLTSGQEGTQIQSPLGLTDIDPALLTPGRQRLVEQVLQGLLDGSLSPLQPQ